MPEIALYYPYIHIRDESWLKAAALYWPRLARLAPAGHPRHDSNVARALKDELGFLLNIEPPTTQVTRVAAEFLEFVSTNHEQLQHRYGPGGEGGCVPMWHDAWREMLEVNPHWHSHTEGRIHARKMTRVLQAELTRLGLGRPVEHGTWLVVHPAIGAVYSMALIDRVALANDLAVVTDQPRLHEVHGGGVGEEFANMLLGVEPRPDHMRDADDVAELYAAIAVQTVIPANLDTVPVKKIVKARRELAAEFDAFREHLDTLAQDFAELAGIESPTILRERLQMLVDRDLRRPTAALERSLRQLGLEPAKAVLGLKTLELPAIAAAASSAVGVPVVAGQAGLVTARLVAAGLESRSRRREARRSSPTGYLLGLKRQLKRRSVLERIRHSIRRADSDR